MIRIELCKTDVKQIIFELERAKMRYDNIKVRGGARKRQWKIDYLLRLLNNKLLKTKNDEKE